jgi:hypothetical protein
MFAAFMGILKLIFWILNNLAPDDGARKKTKTDFYSSKQATQLCC